MGKLTFSLTDNSGNVVTEERAVSDVDSVRIISAYAAIYSSKWLDENGQAFVPNTAQVFKEWVDGVVEGSTANVVSVEKAQAQAAALAQVNNISIA
jgi:hypothetical protein